MNRSKQAARAAGLSMGGIYIDRMVSQHPKAISIMKAKLRTITLAQIRDMVLNDTVQNGPLRGMFSEDELTALAEGFLESACARIDELIGTEKGGN